jgi:hypothetical protein
MRMLIHTYDAVRLIHTYGQGVHQFLTSIGIVRKWSQKLQENVFLPNPKQILLKIRLSIV